jgi:hypothetical protein
MTNHQFHFDDSVTAAIPSGRVAELRRSKKKPVKRKVRKADKLPPTALKNDG